MERDESAHASHPFSAKGVGFGNRLLASGSHALQRLLALSRAMACGCRHPAAGIPGYSGGTAAESHRIPCFSKRAARTRHIMGGTVCQSSQPYRATLGLLPLTVGCSAAFGKRTYPSSAHTGLYWPSLGPISSVFMSIKPSG